MDEDSSPKPSTEGQPQTTDAARTEATETDEPPSIWGRLLGWSGNGHGEDAGLTAVMDPSALGPAFRDMAQAELAMVSNILRLRDLRVEDVMTPRADVVAVAEDATLQEVLDAFEHGGFTRLPVYHETLDDPRGFVHLKDLSLRYGFGRNKPDTFLLSDHIRKAIFVPPSMRIAALLQKMQHDRVHMALVIDEFGGVDGLITIEDLVEQIVGDIEDEHDSADEAAWSQAEDGSWLVQARADIREFEAASGLTLLAEDWDEDVDTVGGLVFMLTNRVPTRGEVIVHPNGHELEIVDADARRVKRVRVRQENGSAPARQAAE